MIFFPCCGISSHRSPYHASLLSAGSVIPYQCHRNERSGGTCKTLRWRIDVYKAAAAAASPLTLDKRKPRRLRRSRMSVENEARWVAGGGGGGMFLHARFFFLIQHGYAVSPPNIFDNGGGDDAVGTSCSCSCLSCKQTIGRGRKRQRNTPTIHHAHPHSRTCRIVAVSIVPLIFQYFVTFCRFFILFFFYFGFLRCWPLGPLSGCLSSDATTA
ncbi:hypothetical protein FN846DRAFT_133590 [Sphaerosporella brunnea]|uniref:Uncharacterized protein n=1 Tax=Sphaerosporella brunnea TaxID=1250544 RepID=A0A5J5F8P6_9PEZI|nr:hypothetical protein FN846DRAFT_133590 [Sphaerosporella brunnea]